MLKFTGKVELNMFKLFLGHGEDVAGVGEEDIAALLVLGHVLVFTLLEVLELLRVVALYPAGAYCQGVPSAARGRTRRT